MNTPSPLIPQGTLPDGRGKSHIRIAVFSILAVHGVLLGTLLIFGCKKAPDQTASDNTILEPTNHSFASPPPAFVQNPTRALEPLPPPPMPGPNIEQTPAPGPIPSSPLQTTAAPPGSGDVQREHVVARGDSFYLMSKKYNATMKAIAQANPGVDSARLKIGQKLVIPAAAMADAGSASTASNDKQHVVKSGDNLTAIARRHGVTVKDLQAANSLRTTQIRVGQKLRIPERTVTPAADTIAPLAPANSSGASGAPPAIQ